MKNKKWKKILNGFVAAAAALTMTMGMTATVLAAPTGGTAANPADAYFAKNLFVPNGLTDATAGDFTFKFEKKDLDGSTTAADLAVMPAITDITLDPITNGTVDSTYTTAQKYSVSSGNIVAGLTFTQPGLYTYTLGEEASYTGTLPTGDTISYSSASYDVTIQVARDAGTNSLYVKAIIVDGITSDNGSNTGTKVTVDEDPTTPESNSFSFNNGYGRTGGGETGDGDTPGGGQGVLTVSKTVTNLPADPADYPAGLMEEFPFTVTLKKPAGENSNPTYHYKVYSAETSSLGAEQSIVFTSETATVNENLKDGDYILFTDLPMGVRYNTSENTGNAITNYSTSYVVAGEGSSTNVSAMLTGEQSINGTGTFAAACTNRYFSEITPTGILLNNLPFIMLIVVAVGAFGAFLIVKRRRIQH